MDPGAAKEPVCLGVVGAAKKLKNDNKSVKFIYSEKATKFSEISTLLLFYVDL